MYYHVRDCSRAVTRGRNEVRWNEAVTAKYSFFLDISVVIKCLSLGVCTQLDSGPSRSRIYATTGEAADSQVRSQASAVWVIQQRP